MTKIPVNPYAPMSFLRLSDSWPLGSLDVNANPQAPGTITAIRSGSGLTQACATLDEGRNWILGNPNVPDLDQYPETHKVYGPVLQTWKGATLVGCVWSMNPHLDPGITKVHKSCFAVVSAQGRVCAQIKKTGSGWHVVVSPRRGAAVLTAVQGQLHNALQLLVQWMAQQVLSLTGHEVLSMMQEVTSIHAQARDFLSRRAAWRDALLVSSSDSLRIPHQARMTPWRCPRRLDGFQLGAIGSSPDGFIATRTGFSGGMYRERGINRSMSLDALVRWLQASPHAPDLDRFPWRADTYGTTLLALPRAVVIGPVLKVKFEDDRHGRLMVLSHTHQRIGTVLFSDTTQTWRRILNRIPVTSGTFEHAELAVVLQDLYENIVAWHPARTRAGLRADAPQALARMRAFIDSQAHQVEEFEQGQGPWA